MQIYNWCGGQKVAEYTGTTEQFSRAIRWYAGDLGDPLPLISDWRAPLLTQYRGATGKRKLRPVTDCVVSAAVNFVSEKSAECLDDIWRRHARLYPVRLDNSDRRYFMVVSTTVLDCIDRKNSTGPLQKYGPTPDFFASVHTWQFDEECVGDADLFVIPDSPTNIFVSERFKKRVRESGLTGFTLRDKFWDPNPWQS
jgi:hypothetical protein